MLLGSEEGAVANKYRRPRALTPGDTVAVLSPSWGGPHSFPHIFDRGIATLRGWGLQIKEYPSTRMDANALRSNTAQRVADIHDAFADPQIAAIIASIGGDDSMLLLPHLDGALIGRHPKILLGYSDTTTLLTFAHLQGMVTFHGPSVMSGLAQLASHPTAHRTHLHTMLFSTQATLNYTAARHYSDGYIDWADPQQRVELLPTQFSRGWQFLQGKGVHRGQLFGGNIEVLEFIKGTRYWPEPDFWYDKLFFLETSEEKPSITAVTRWLRNYGIQGIFHKIAGLLFGRAKDYSLREQIALDAAILQVVRDEFGARELPIVTHVDIGHTEPQWIMPLGVMAHVDCREQHISLVEPWLRG